MSSVPSFNLTCSTFDRSLYFDSADGFGDWMVVISKKAEDVLRSTRRRDQTTFDIIVKKLKELSHGHFSPDNHKKLAGTAASDVPVYEAKMTRDSRLIVSQRSVQHGDC